MDEKKKIDEIDVSSDVEVGEILRRTRVHYGQTLKDVEHVLRIRQSQIDAIEKGEIFKLPGRVYAIGFVRSYAEYLGLDGAKVVQLFKAQYMDRQPKEVLSFPVPASETRTPPVWVVTLTLGVVILLLAGWGVWQSSDNYDVSKIEPLPEEIKERVAAQVTPAITVTEPKVVSAGSQVQQKKTGMILNIKSSSWVEIKDGEGKILVSEVLKKGDQYFVPDSPGLTMSLGNAGGIEVVLNGKPLMPLGKEGDVMRDIPLDVTHLKTLEFKPEGVKTAPVPEN